MRALAAAGELEDDGERGAVAAAGDECAGVAVGEDAGAVGQVGEQVGAVAGDGRAHLSVFGVDGASFGEQASHRLGGRPTLRVGARARLALLA